MFRFDQEVPSQNLEPVFSVTEFIEYINLAIGRRKVVVEGEVSSFHVNQGKWVFFDLKDEDSKISCFMMVYSLDVAVEDGMQVRITGAPRVHGKSGKFSIFVERIELHGLGALKRAFELTKVKLAKEGLFAPERKRSLPQFPEKIGLIASRESAAYTDFMRILNQRWSGVTISLAHVQVQGESAIKEICQAFDWFNQNSEAAEAIVLIRGGGSLEDLQAFNSEAIARAIFGSRLPVLCGVGHERDETLADYVADVRAATPTHAATLIVPDQEEIRSTLHAHIRTMEGSLENWFEWYDHRIHQSIGTFSHAFQATEYAVKNCIHRFNGSLDSLGARLREYAHHTQEYRKNILTRFDHAFVLQEANLTAITRSLSNMNPLTVLKRGYSIVRSERGGIIKRVKDVKKGDPIDVTVSDGSFHASVAPKQGRLV